ncbi:MAG: PspA/IM30 family protein [Firmicutes bacterium]|nr:PspA/IM30 family protein [Bacillota bacterium]
MGIFQRIANLIRANVNELLDRAEDPEKLLKQMILDMEESVREGKIALAAAIAEETKLKARYEEQIQKAQEWLEKAERAVEKGEEDLARESLRRRRTAEQMAEQAKAQWEEQRRVVAQLREHLETLESRLAEAKAKKDLLIARKRRAEAAKKVHEQLAGLTRSQSAFETFEKMEEKIAHLEAQAEAAKRVQEDSLEERLRRLGEDEEIEEDLAALKARLQERHQEG